MQRVRKFLVVKDRSPLGSRLPPTVFPDAIHCEGWHQTWDTALELTDLDIKTNVEFEVAVADESNSRQIIAIFSTRNLESVEQEAGATKWRSVRISVGDGFWCNLNYSDYGWGWISGASREVPFRLRYLERQAEANPNGLVSRALFWVLEARDWFYGHSKKIG